MVAQSLVQLFLNILHTLGRSLAEACGDYSERSPAFAGESVMINKRGGKRRMHPR